MSSVPVLDLSDITDLTAPPQTPEVAPFELPFDPEEEVSKVISKAQEVFTAEMTRRNIAHYSWDDLPQQVKSAYIEIARIAWLQDYVNEQNKNAPGNQAVVEVDDCSHDVNIKSNTPNIFLFLDDSKEELFRLIKTCDGKLDVLLTDKVTYTQAAKAFLQIVFDQANVTRNSPIDHALELMRQGHWVTRGAWVDNKSFDSIQAYAMNPSTGEFYYQDINPRNPGIKPVIGLPIRLTAVPWSIADLEAKDWMVWGKLRRIGKAALDLD